MGEPQPPPSAEGGVGGIPPEPSLLETLLSRFMLLVDNMSWDAGRYDSFNAYVDANIVWLLPLAFVVYSIYCWVMQRVLANASSVSSPAPAAAVSTAAPGTGKAPAASTDSAGMSAREQMLAARERQQVLLKEASVESEVKLKEQAKEGQKKKADEYRASMGLKSGKDAESDDDGPARFRGSGSSGYNALGGGGGGSSSSYRPSGFARRGGGG